jgi:hypothetical protein
VTVSARDRSTRVYDLTEPREVKFPAFRPQDIDRIISTPRARDAGSRLVEPVPPAVLFAWPSINREGKEAILLNYLRFGLIIDISGDSSGFSYSTKLLFAEKISSRNRERMDVFLASLSPEQRRRFGGPIQAAIRMDASPKDAGAALASGREQKAQRDEVIAELTAEQSKLYEFWRAGIEH